MLEICAKQTRPSAADGKAVPETSLFRADAVIWGRMALNSSSRFICEVPLLEARPAELPAVCSENLNPNIMVMESAEDGR